MKINSNRSGDFAIATSIFIIYLNYLIKILNLWFTKLDYLSIL